MFVTMATKIEIKQNLAVVVICSATIFIIQTVCLLSSNWVTSGPIKLGLLILCIEKLDPQEPLPFDLNNLDVGCYLNRDKGYLRLCTCLCLITQFCALATSCLAGLGLRFRRLKRASCLQLAICTTLVTLFCDVCLLIVYPTQFAKELDRSNRDLWELNIAFGLACGAAIIAMGVLVILVVTLRKITNVYESAPTKV